MPYQYYAKNGIQMTSSNFFMLLVLVKSLMTATICEKDEY